MGDRENQPLKEIFQHLIPAIQKGCSSYGERRSAAWLTMPFPFPSL